MPAKLTAGDRVDGRGRLQAAASDWARAAIREKLYSGYDWATSVKMGEKGAEFNEKHRDAQTARAAKIEAELRTWEFYKLRAGYVDDVNNTDESWVETAYVVHHIGGAPAEQLDLFAQSSGNPERANVGTGIWRSIDSTPREPHTMQYYAEPAVGEAFSVQMIPVAQPFDVAAEYELWHGDHAFVSQQLEQFVKTFFEYTGPAKHGFGASKPKHTWMTMRKTV